MKKWLKSILEKKKSRRTSEASQGSATEALQGSLPQHAPHLVLTGMMSQPEFERAVSRVAASGEGKGCLMLADVDSLGEINDRYGQEAGDRVLEYVCRVLRDSLGEDDGMCQVKSGEFALWLTGTTVEDTAAIRTKIAAVNDTLLHPSRGVLPVSVSVGAAFLKAGETFPKSNEKFPKMEEASQKPGDMHKEEASQKSEEIYKTLYKQAGKAERRVKNGGRCGFAAYED